MSEYDLAVKWPDKPQSIARLRRLNGVPIYGRPQHLRVPGGQVWIIGAKNRLLASFRAAKIEGPRMVTLAKGQRKSGYVVRARKGSFKSASRRSDVPALSIRWQALGQFRYIDAATGTVRTIDERARGGGTDLEESETGEDRRHEANRFTAKPYSGGIPGKRRSNPEARLVDAFVAWFGDDERFFHPYFRSDRHHADLFDRRHWRLIEAKARCDRNFIREAVGQLLDYRRHFARSPSLGILLPERPSKSVLAYLGACRVTVIWRTPSGRFSDSLRGKWCK